MALTLGIDKDCVLIEGQNDSAYFLFHCVKSVQIRSFFWSVFSCIRAEYGDLRSVLLTDFYTLLFALWYIS